MVRDGSHDICKDNEYSLPRTSDQDPLKKFNHKASIDRTKSSAGLTTGGDTAEIHLDKKPRSHLKKCQSDLFFNLYDDDPALSPPKSIFFFAHKKKKGSWKRKYGKGPNGRRLLSQKPIKKGHGLIIQESMTDIFKFVKDVQETDGNKVGHSCLSQKSVFAEEKDSFKKDI
jgi:hypothetical protein